MSGKSNDNNQKKSEALQGEKLYDAPAEVSFENVNTILGANADFKSRALLIRDNPLLPVILCYMDGLVDGKSINDFILKPLTQEKQFDACKTAEDAIRLISMGKVYSSAMKLRTNVKSLVDDILGGSVSIIFNDAKAAFTFEVKSEIKRSVSEPVGESVLKGPRDSFVEELRVNTTLCRRNIKSPFLTIEELLVGKQTKTTVAVVYIKNITEKKIVDEVKKRLEAIDTDIVINPGKIEELIVDNKFSIFPQIMYTERPDRFCVNISEGRVGIIIEGLPISYVVPAVMLQFVQAPDDYSYNFIIGSTLRFIRFLAMFITIALPGFYISITTFHPEMLPAELAFSIVASREGVPFPMFIEVVILLFSFEFLLEAGVRLPKSIAQTVSIVGALVVGQAAVEAKILSPATVIIIALTVIAGFTMPNQDFSNALRFWRFIFVLTSSIIGILGLAFGFIFLLYHLCKMETFGVPYLDPFVANEDEQLQDTFFRLPFKAMEKRPSGLNPNNDKRME